MTHDITLGYKNAIEEWFTHTGQTVNTDLLVDSPVMVFVLFIVPSVHVGVVRGDLLMGPLELLQEDNAADQGDDLSFTHRRRRGSKEQGWDKELRSD